MSVLVRPAETVIAKWRWLHDQGVPSDDISKQLWPFDDAEIRGGQGGWRAVPKAHGLTNDALSKGYLYVLTNPSMPGLLKIGHTTGSPKRRAEQLYATGVPTPFRVEWSSGLLATVGAAEREAHSLLFSVRVDQAREFFRTTMAAALPLLEGVESKYLDTTRQDAWRLIELQNVQLLAAQQRIVDEWESWSRHPRVRAVADEVCLIEGQHHGPGVVWSLFSWVTGHEAQLAEEGRRAAAQDRVRRAEVWCKVRDMTSDQLWLQLAKFDWRFSYIWEGVGRPALAHKHGNPAEVLPPDSDHCWARSALSPDVCGGPAAYQLYGQGLCATHGR